MKKKIESTIHLIRDYYRTEDFIPLHAPVFRGHEKDYLNECIDSTFVSSVGKFVDQFEEKIVRLCGCPHAIATMNGTAALHIALILAGVQRNEEVITQALTFVATPNAIKYIGADPIFLDSDKDNMGLSVSALEKFLDSETEIRDGKCINKKSKKVISACVPMHVFGHAVEIEKIVSLCHKFKIKVIEDAAESVGSFMNEQHLGTFADIGVLSFNGNKTITCGGGGIIIVKDKNLAKRAKHLTTTGKIPHKWEFFHDEVAYNYRMPNLNAALGVAQLEQLDEIIAEKRMLASIYADHFASIDIDFFTEGKNQKCNYWLNALILQDSKEKEEWLENLNANNIMARPVWTLMNKLPAFRHCQADELKNAKYLEQRVINIPSGCRTNA